MNRKAVGNKKVAIIGSGYVGSSIAYALALREIAREIAIIDINKEKASGEAFDIRHGIQSMGTADLYAGDYTDCKDCDLIIITAGRNRKPGETRIDLTQENVKIMKSVIDSVKEHYNGGVILIVSNPVDILTYKVTKWMNLPDGTVFGSGCILDTSRFVRCVADYVGLSTGVVNGYVVGEHGDGQVPVWSEVSIGGVPIAEYCDAVGLKWDESVKEDIATRTRTMGADIISRKERTHFGIATCICHLADAILNQKPTVAAVSSELMGEHGVRDVALSVTSIVGPMGVHKRIRDRWAPEEYRAFFDAVESTKEVLKQIDI